MEEAVDRLERGETVVMADWGGNVRSRGGVVFETSGSTGQGKLVWLSRDAVFASARMVNAHLGAGRDDTWVRAVPGRHVGGFGIHVRARAAGSRVVVCEGRWDPGGFVRTLETSGATLSALVPTQVFDLAEAGLACPTRVRAVVVGGGRLNDPVQKRALELGWPLLRSWGMTEAGSQIATETAPGTGMQVLDGWEVRRGEGGLGEIRGEALFGGYIDRSTAEAAPASDSGGWFQTADVIGLTGRTVDDVRRSGRVVKVLGELVDLDAIEEAIGRGVVIAVPHDRAGSRVILVVEPEDRESAADAVAAYNGRVAGPLRVGAIERIDRFPRTAVGKVRLGALVEQFS